METNQTNQLRANQTKQPNQPKPTSQQLDMGNQQSADSPDQAGPGISFEVHQVKPRVDIDSLETKPASLFVRSRFLERQHQKLVKHAIDCSADELLALTPVKNQLVAAMVLAFDNHLELSLRPQHFWLAVCQAVSLHVAGFAEQLRSRIVAHQGRTVLTIDVTDQLADSIDWQAVVADFAKQIQANTIDQAAKLFQCQMAATTNVEHVCANMTAMDACKSYFEYRVSTCCGFPKIHLQGSLKDWQLLQSQTHLLVNKLCMPAFASTWLPILDSVFDRFLAAWTGAVDVEFWESMAKRGGTRGSGSYSYVNGWVNAFFPYSAPGKPNMFCKPYRSGSDYTAMVQHWSGGTVLQQAGLDVLEFPDGLCAAPARLDSNNLEFRGGFVGVARAGIANCVTPAVGWFVSCSQNAEPGNQTSAGFDANYMMTQAGVRIQLEDFVKQH